MCLAKQDKARRFNILMAVKERRMKLKMRMTRKHPFNPKVYPVTAKHVGPKKLGGSEAIQEKVALHVVQPVGYDHPVRKRFVTVKEMVPEFIVPDLTDFKLKPYVPYNAPEINQSKFTAKDLFDSCYADEIEEKFREGKITLESLKKNRITNEDES